MTQPFEALGAAHLAYRRPIQAIPEAAMGTLTVVLASVY